MAEIYPIPKFAANIWLAGDMLCIGLPPDSSHERGHTVRIPLSKLSLLRPAGEWEQEHNSVDLARYAGTVGFSVLLELLRERERQGRIQPIGNKSEPTQYDIDAILHRVTKYASKGRQEAATTLADLGLE